MEARGRGVRFDRKGKLSPAQIVKAQKLIEQGERAKDVTALWNASRVVLFCALSLVGM
jgi:hypothetical protein